MFRWRLTDLRKAITRCRRIARPRGLHREHILLTFDVAAHCGVNGRIGSDHLVAVVGPSCCADRVRIDAIAAGRGKCPVASITLVVDNARLKNYILLCKYFGILELGRIYELRPAVCSNIAFPTFPGFIRAFRFSWRRSRCGSHTSDNSLQT